MKNKLREKQAEERKRLEVQARELPEEDLTVQTRIWLRIAKARGVDVKSLIDEEYNPVKKLDADEKRAAMFASLNKHYTVERNGGNDSTDSS